MKALGQGFFIDCLSKDLLLCPNSFFCPSHFENNTQHSECKNVDSARLWVSTTGKKFWGSKDALWEVIVLLISVLNFQCSDCGLLNSFWKKTRLKCAGFFFANKYAYPVSAQRVI